MDDATPILVGLQCVADAVLERRDVIFAKLDELRQQAKFAAHLIVVDKEALWCRRRRRFSSAFCHDLVVEAGLALLDLADLAQDAHRVEWRDIEFHKEPVGQNATACCPLIVGDVQDRLVAFDAIRY